jgi:hypothetical protein
MLGVHEGVRWGGVLLCLVGWRGDCGPVRILLGGAREGGVAVAGREEHLELGCIFLLDFLGTWVAGGLGLGVLGLPQAPQSPCEFVFVDHALTPISSSACSVCSFLFFFTSINIFVLFCFVLNQTLLEGLKGLCRTKEKPDPVLVE